MACKDSFPYFGMPLPGILTDNTHFGLQMRRVAVVCRQKHFQVWIIGCTINTVSFEIHNCVDTFRNLFIAIYIYEYMCGYTSAASP